MKRIALIIGKTDRFEDGNYLRFANHLLSTRRLSQEMGVWLLLMDSLCLNHNRVSALASQLTEGIVPDQPFPSFSHQWLDEFDVVWILNLGTRAGFLDKIQLLYNLQSPKPQGHSTRVINSLDSIMYLKSKYFLASLPELIKYPDTWASSNPEFLYQIIKNKGGSWIIKPPAGSFGREVFKLESSDPNIQLILETLTGSEQDQYCLLQRYVEEISAGEKRVLIANGKPIGQYLRIANEDHRTNLMQGASAGLCDLSTAERLYCEQIGEFLLSKGTFFAGIDLVFPWVIEINVINPGGITTIDQLGGGNLATEVVDSVIDGSGIY